MKSYIIKHNGKINIRIISYNFFFYVYWEFSVNSIFKNHFIRTKSYSMKHIVNFINVKIEINNWKHATLYQLITRSLYKFLDSSPQKRTFSSLWNKTSLNKTFPNKLVNYNILYIINYLASKGLTIENHRPLSVKLEYETKGKPHHPSRNKISIKTFPDKLVN